MKNTVFLYIRMFFIMGIALFTSRVVLKTLGVVDFGIYNVIGGVVSMMGVVNTAMSVATSRYLTFNIGKNDTEELHKTFCISLTIYLWMCLIFFILAEAIGVWFINTQLNIPSERVAAANWVFQFTIFSTIFAFLQNPYSSSVIAHERMNFYSVISIIEAIFKLVIVYCLLTIPFDRLIVYSGLYMIISLSVFLSYRYYCIRHFEECHFVAYKDSKLFHDILSFSGWNMFGALAGIARTQGLNILLNIFFNPVVNAARGIAVQVSAATSMFYGNFSLATRPQITKYYAQKDYNNMNLLVFRSSKFSFFLLWIISLPILIETPTIIRLWLGQIPEYVIQFTRIIILITAVDSLSSPIMTICHATGHIKLYQFVVGMINIMTLPVSYIFLKLGYPPISVFIVSLIMTIIATLLRLIIAKKLVPQFPLISYCGKVVAVSFFIAIFSSLFPFWYHSHFEQTLLNAIINGSIAVVITILIVFFWGMNKSERGYILQLIQAKVFHK